MLTYARHHPIGALLLIYVLLWTSFTYWDRWSEAGAACRAKGGRIYVEGCFKLEMTRVE